MGRRAVPAINPELDLSQRLKTFDDLPQPWDADKLFSAPELQSAPLEVEVGSGKGLFLQNAAASVPDRKFLGIEVARKYAKFAASRLAKRNLENAVMVSGDALRIFRELLPNQCVRAVHVYFPDPWWKKRHRKRRVLTPEFLRDVARVLEPNGELHFWTDVQEYFESTLELLDELAILDGPRPVPERAPEHDLDYQTHFERRKRQDGLPIYRSLFVKT